MLCSAQGGAQALKRGLVAEVPMHILHKLGKLGKGCFVNAAVLFQALTGMRLELFEGPVGPCHADDGYVEVPMTHHRLKRGIDLLFCKIASHTKKDECI